MIRHASLNDLQAMTALEAACFPAAEAASEERFRDRLTVFPDRFWLLEEEGRLIACVNGCLSDEEILRDEMYADASLHTPDGGWQMIFGVETLPEYRHRGIMQDLLRQVIEDCRAEGRKGLILTCKEHLVGFYAGFGFVSEGISESEHGGAVWYQMKLIIDT